jgi:hypothetical protein
LYPRCVPIRISASNGRAMVAKARPCPEGRIEILCWAQRKVDGTPDLSQRDCHSTETNGNLIADLNPPQLENDAIAIPKGDHLSAADESNGCACASISTGCRCGTPQIARCATEVHRCHPEAADPDCRRTLPLAMAWRPPATLLPQPRRPRQISQREGDSMRRRDIKATR